MKPHLRLRTTPFGNFKEWVCEERFRATQRSVAGYVATYIGSGSTPVEAFEKCQQVKRDRTKL